MTVTELIEHLSTLPPNVEVVAAPNDMDGCYRLHRVRGTDHVGSRPVCWIELECWVQQPDTPWPDELRDWSDWEGSDHGPRTSDQ